MMSVPLGSTIVYQGECTPSSHVNACEKPHEPLPDRRYANKIPQYVLYTPMHNIQSTLYDPPAATDSADRHHLQPLGQAGGRILAGCALS